MTRVQLARTYTWYKLCNSSIKEPSAGIPYRAIRAFSRWETRAEMDARRSKRTPLESAAATASNLARVALGGHVN